MREYVCEKVKQVTALETLSIIRMGCGACHRLSLARPLMLVVSKRVGTAPRLNIWTPSQPVLLVMLIKRR